MFLIKNRIIFKKCDIGETTQLRPKTRNIFVSIRFIVIGNTNPYYGVHNRTMLLDITISLGNQTFDKALK